MKPTEKPQPTSIRLPVEMKRHLRLMAAIHEQSLSDEILVRLRRTISEKERAAGAEIGVNTPAAETIQQDGQEAV